ADTCGNTFAQHQRGAWGRAGQEFVDQPQVPFPDDGDAVKDGDEKDTLGQDAGGHKVQVRQAAGGDGPRPAEDLPEHQQPQRRLYGAGEQFGGVVANFAQFQFGNNQRLTYESGDPFQ